MLNDLSSFTRRTLFFQMLPFGLLLSVVLASRAGLDDTTLKALLVILVAFLVLEVAWCVGVIVVTRRADRRLIAEVERGSREIVEGRVHPRTAIGRVRRRRVKRSKWTSVPGTDPSERGAYTLVVVLDVIGDGPPRMVAALLPPALILGARKQFLSLKLHPEMPEVAVVDLGVAPQEVAQTANADPQWCRERPRGNRLVVGGYLALVAASFLGMVAGAVFGSAALILL